MEASSSNVASGLRTHKTHVKGLFGVAALKYQGRPVSRVNSEQRRRTILEAALRIVVRDGVRGVRHRAVAKEAGVPLSATTYYFKDINDLITDTFTLFVELGAEKFKAFWGESDDKLQNALAVYDRSLNCCDGTGFETNTEMLAQRQQFIVMMTDLAMDYVMRQLTEQRDYLIAERAFQVECLRNDNLRPVAFSYQAYLMDSLIKLFNRVGSSCAELDAKIFASILTSVEYQGLIQEPVYIDQSVLRACLYRQIETMLCSSVFLKR